MSFWRVVAVGAMVLAALLAFAAYRGPELALALFAAWRLCL